jgi:hypothetical protein
VKALPLFTKTTRLPLRKSLTVNWRRKLSAHTNPTPHLCNPHLGAWATCALRALISSREGQQAYVAFHLGRARSLVCPTHILLVQRWLRRLFQISASQRISIVRLAHSTQTNAPRAHDRSPIPTRMPCTLPTPHRRCLGLVLSGSMDGRCMEGKLL